MMAKVLGFNKAVMACHWTDMTIATWRGVAEAKANFEPSIYLGRGRDALDVTNSARLHCSDTVQLIEQAKSS